MKTNTMQLRLSAAIAGLLVLSALTGCADEVSGAASAPSVAESAVVAVNKAAVQEVLTVNAEGNSVVEPVALQAVLDSVPVTGLTENEISGLLLMREEEKLAHDVYVTLYELWGQPVFQNIANAELTHTDAVLRILERYDIADPVGDNGVGVFTNPELQSLYDDLVAQGSVSLEAALRVGAAVEEIDILDLEELSSQTRKADILTVYASLSKGSRNHLRSFVQTLERRTGESTTPQFMSQEAYDAILASGIERGGQAGGGQSTGRPAGGNQGNRGGRRR